MRTLAERFESKHVPEPNSGCFLWTDATSKKGYGWFRVGKKNRRAHCVGYELFHGEITTGMQVLHRCDNPTCVNPDHLFLGTDRANMADREAKGRTARGDKSGARLHPEKLRRGEGLHNAVLTEESVLRIRDLYSRGRATQMELSDMFGVIQPTISQVVRRVTWTHI